ncbi:unnamed protein product [Phaeothamnion confervicola]
MVCSFSRFSLSRFLPTATPFYVKMRPREPTVEAMPPSVLPTLDHFDFRDYDTFYEPSDDTYLLIDALHADTAWLKDCSPKVCLELGPGSGVVLTSLHALLAGVGHHPILLAVDVNPAATAATAATAAANGATLVETVCADLAFCLADRLAGVVDVLVFNPPYVPTPPSEVGGGGGASTGGAGGAGGIQAAWAGGERGRQVIDRFLPLVPKLLSPGGCLYLVLVVENDPAEVASWLKDRGLAVTMLAVRRARNERLYVLKAVKPAGMASIGSSGSNGGDDIGARNGSPGGRAGGSGSCG